MKSVKSITFRLNQTNFLDEKIRRKIAKTVNSLPYEFDAKKVKYYEDDSIEYFGKKFDQKSNSLIKSSIKL